MSGVIGMTAGYSRPPRAVRPARATAAYAARYAHRMATLNGLLCVVGHNDWTRRLHQSNRRHDKEL